MKRWLLPIVVVCIVLTSAILVARREMVYRSTLEKYSRHLKPGSRRTEVESYLRARNASFSWAFTSFGSHETQYGDLVKVGEEFTPWFCGKANVYVAFEFSRVGKVEQNGSDLLERIEIFRPYDCL